MWSFGGRGGGRSYGVTGCRDVIARNVVVGRATQDCSGVVHRALGWGSSSIWGSGFSSGHLTAQEGDREIPFSIASHSSILHHFSRRDEGEGTNRLSTTLERANPR